MRQNTVVLKEIQTIDIMYSHLQRVVTDHCIASVQTDRLHIYLKHELIMNKHQKVFHINRGTHHFSSLILEKLISLICG